MSVVWHLLTAIETEYYIVYNFNDKSVWVFLNVNAFFVACTLSFYGTYVPFCFWDLFIEGSNLDHYALCV